MIDIVPELLEAIQLEFRTEITKNKTIQEVQKLIKAGTSTYEQANNFAEEVGTLLAKAFKKKLSSDVLPDGKMYYNIADRILNETMNESYQLVSLATTKIQENLNKSAGLGLKAIKPELNQDRIDGLVNKISNAEKFDDVAWALDEPVINFHEAIVDDAVKANADFHAKAGLSPEIIRKSTGKCCDWCDAVVGVHKYPNVPEGVYRRHQYCRCTVEYDPKTGKRQNVWDKSWSEDEKSKKEREARINFEPPNEPKKFSMGTAVNEYFYSDDGYKKWKESLTDNDRLSITEYTSNTYKQINSYNRKNFNWSPDGAFGSVIDEAEKFMINPPDILPQQPDELFFAYKRRVNAIIPPEYSNAIASKERAIENTKKLDDIIGKYELKDNIRTYRAIEPDALPDFVDLDDLVGKPYSDKSFMSTSPTIDSRAVNKDYIMEITVPKGVGNGVYLEEFTAVSGEYEFLIPRNKNFKITGIRIEGNKKIIKMEMQS